MPLPHFVRHAACLAPNEIDYGKIALNVETNLHAAVSTRICIYVCI